MLGETQKPILPHPRSPEYPRAREKQILISIIAASTRTTVEVVGRRRAVQIAKEARPGHMIQDDKGKWNIASLAKP
jgi:hypothetical protein